MIYFNLKPLKRLRPLLTVSPKTILSLTTPSSRGLCSLTYASNTAISGLPDTTSVACCCSEVYRSPREISEICCVRAWYFGTLNSWAYNLREI